MALDVFLVAEFILCACSSVNFSLEMRGSCQPIKAAVNGCIQEYTIVNCVDVHSYGTKFELQSNTILSC